MKHTFHYFPDILGIIGVILVLLFYSLLQTGRCTANDFSFSFFNAVGSVLILVSLWFHWNLASVIIEIAWLAISLFGLARVILKKTS